VSDMRRREFISLLIGPAKAEIPLRIALTSDERSLFRSRAALEPRATGRSALSLSQGILLSADSRSRSAFLVWAEQFRYCS
jgi:hypothetical protein